MNTAVLQKIFYLQNQTVEEFDLWAIVCQPLTENDVIIVRRLLKENIVLRKIKLYFCD